jgi:uncharacterized protein YjiK
VTRFRSFAIRSAAVALASIAAMSSAQAAILDLSQYEVAYAVVGGHSVNYALTNVAEGSGITYNWDRDSLFGIGDGGQMQEWNTDAYQRPGIYGIWWSTGGRGATAPLADPEAVTYVGNGQYVVADERTGNIWKFSYDPTKTITRKDGTQDFIMTAPDTAYHYNVSGGVNWGNTGLEGISYDPITGGFFAIKESGPERVMFISWDFNTPNSTGTTTDLFDPAGLGLETLSDITTLSTVAAFDDKDFRSNLLILSQSSQLLLEVTRTGEVVSRFDLSNIINTESGKRVTTIEGVTLDNEGNIYLLAEQGGTSISSSSIIKLARSATGAVPEPSTWAMMIAGFGAIGGQMRRRRSVKVAFA